MFKDCMFNVLTISDSISASSRNLSSDGRAVSILQQDAHWPVIRGTILAFLSFVL